MKHKRMNGLFLITIFTTFSLHTSDNNDIINKEEIKKDITQAIEELKKVVEKNDNQDQKIISVTGEKIQDLVPQIVPKQQVQNQLLDNPFKKYRYIFKSPWTDKETNLNNVQELPLGKFYRFWKKDLDIFKDVLHRTKNDETGENGVIIKDGSTEDGIIPRKNLSIARKICNALIIQSLKTDIPDLNTIKETLDLCYKHKIDHWTAPDISKNAIDKKRKLEKQDFSLKNFVKEAFALARSTIKTLIDTDVTTFLKNTNPKHITPETPQIFDKNIIKFKELYILAIMAYNIHGKIFTSYTEIEKEFKDVQTMDILQFVVPEKVDQIKDIQKSIQAIKIEAENVETKKKQALQTTSQTNLDQTTVINPKNQ